MDRFRAPLPVKNKVREYRVDKNWTQAALAEVLDVSRQTVIAIERGKYDPSLRLAFRIAGIFARPLDDIFVPETGHGPENTPTYCFYGDFFAD